MATKHKKEKRKLRKQKKREEHLKEEQKELEKSKCKIDIINVLKNELYDTKPNVAKLLEKYVVSIRLYICNNIEIYPEFKYNISKIFIRFKDNSELIRLNGRDSFDYIIERDFKDQKLTEKEKELIS
jgi:hypothetical protein